MALQLINTKGEPGILFPFVAHSIETGVMQDDKALAGGFALWGKIGEPGNVWANKPEASEAVARVVDVEIAGTVAEGDKFSVSINGTKYEVTAPATPTAAGIATALATAIDADANYGATASGAKVTITASTAGAAANADTFAVDKSSAAGTIAKTETTAGKAAVAGGFFLGIAQLTTVNDEYFEGDLVNVVKKGRIWVKVSGEVLANQAAYVDDEGNFSATDTGTAIEGGVFKSNSAANGIAELEIA